MATKLETIEGLGPVYAEKLVGAGINSVEELLAKGNTAAAQERLAEATGISAKLIGGWVRRADLMRVKGVGEEYSDLLAYAGVDSTAVLAIQDAEELAAKMQAVNEERKLVRRAPSAKSVAGWIEGAKLILGGGAARIE